MFGLLAWSAGMEAGERGSANAGVAAAAESSTIGPSVDKLSEILDKMSAMQASMNNHKQEIVRLSKTLQDAEGRLATATAVNVDSVPDHRRVNTMKKVNVESDERISVSNIVQQLEAVQESVKEQQSEISRLSKCLLETEGCSGTRPARKSCSRPKSNACFKCGGLGHFARDHKGRGRRDKCSTEFKLSKVVGLNSFSDCTYLSAELHGRKVSVQLNTGYQCNVIGRNLIPDVELKPMNPEWIGWKFCDNMSVLGTAEINLAIGKMSFSVNVVVCRLTRVLLCRGRGVVAVVT